MEVVKSDQKDKSVGGEKEKGDHKASSAGTRSIVSASSAHAFTRHTAALRSGPRDSRQSFTNASAQALVRSVIIRAAIHDGCEAHRA